MNKPTEPLLSTKQLILSLIVAMIVGVGLTIFVILPAEKGEDPTGFGAKSGLGELSSTKEEVPEIETTSDVLPLETLYAAINPETTPPKINEFGQSLPAVDGVNIRVHDATYKSESIEILIDIDGQVEYKAIMDGGEVLLYAWEADGELYYDFHAHQEKGDPNFWTRYSEGEATKDQGSIVAPYQGEHGWYWLNIADKPIKIKLTVAGYYDEIKEIPLKAAE
ncbi:MAG: hypothetical protein ACI9SC_002743 [Gammaproteobacteria bacterium]|jgi:hypothetical protein